MIAFGKALRRSASACRRLKLPGCAKQSAGDSRAIARAHVHSHRNEDMRAKTNRFGLTTMKDRHVKVKGSKLRFPFSRQERQRNHEVDVTDRHIAKINFEAPGSAGPDLFQYVDDTGEIRDITSQDVNAYLREITTKISARKIFGR
jgi:DNA topoisomerase IB